MSVARGYWSNAINLCRQITALSTLWTHSRRFRPSNCTRLQKRNCFSRAKWWTSSKNLTAMDEATVTRLRLLKHHRFDEWHTDDIHECSTQERAEVNTIWIKFCSTNLGRLFFKYLKVLVNEARCLSGSDSGSIIKQMNEQMSLPPIVIVTIFQSYLKLTLLSFLMRCTKAFACEDVHAIKMETKDPNAIISRTYHVGHVARDSSDFGQIKLGCFVEGKRVAEWIAD